MSKQLNFVQVQVVRFLTRNPLFYCLVIFYFQWNRVKNLLESSADVLVHLNNKYPFHSLAYQLKLENEYNPFPKSLNGSIFSQLPPLPFASIEKGYQWSHAFESRTLNNLDNLGDEPDENELLVLHSLLDAVRALNLLKFYIPLLSSLLAFSTVFFI